MCNHCFSKNSVEFITAGHISNLVPRIIWISRIKKSTQVRLGFHEQLDKLINDLAPTLYVGVQHDQIFKPYISYGCQNKFKAKNIKFFDISEIVLCGGNVTIYHLMFNRLYRDVTHPDEATQPVIYEEDHLMLRYVKLFLYKVAYIENTFRIKTSQ